MIGKYVGVMYLKKNEITCHRKQNRDTSFPPDPSPDPCFSRTAKNTFFDLMTYTIIFSCVLLNNLLITTTLLSGDSSAMILLVLRQDPKKGSSGSSFRPPARSGPLTQYVAVLSSACNAICCVHSLPHVHSLSTLKGRYAYSVCVVHFRKVLIRQKIGSHRNGHPVIY